MQLHNNSKKSIALPVYIALAICLGVFIGANMAGNTSTASSELIKSLNKFRQVITFVDTDYVDEVQAELLVEDAIASMLKNLDPHTSYIPAKDLDVIQSRLEGNYEGIGIEFNIFKDTIFVVSPLSGGPSEKLGLRSGDRIVKVDDENVAGVGMTNDRVVGLLRGEGGSKVKVSIKRSGESNLIDFEITRDVIPQHSVDVSYMVDDEIGYIKISRFANSTYLEFKEALLKLREQGMTKLVLDLTANPGGYLQRAVQIADEFIAGRKMIVYTDGKEKRYTENHFSGESGDFEKGSLVIMVDEGSASASEIVAGAIQDHDRGLIVGRRSYGKGLVQLPLDLNDGSQLRLTISKYYTPSGRSIQKKYGKDKSDYFREAYDRYMTGELYSEDSIKFNDSLTFKTGKGRKVYGGGGIAPDVFVPLDSSQNNRYINRLFATNSMQEYALRYANEHTDELRDGGYALFKADFEVSDQMLNELVAVGVANNLPFDEKAFSNSMDMIRLYTKAYIARSLWDNEGFYPIFNEQDEIYLKAITLMEKADEVAEM